MLKVGVFCVALVLQSYNVYAQCFAYIHDGNVFSACGGSLHKLTRSGDITDFSISMDGGFAAIEREQVTPIDKDTGELKCEISIIDLNSARPLRKVHDCGELESSCGTILMEGRDRVQDLLTGGDLRFAGCSRFVCDPSRSVIAGWPGDSNHDFAVGIAPKKVAAIAGRAAVSKSGRIAFWTDSSDTDSVCEFQSGAPVCLQGAGAFDKISIDDAGAVLFSTYMGGGCFYRGYKIIKAPRNDPGDDQCVGIALWKPNNRNILIKVPVKELARKPQWLTPEAVARIDRCSKVGCLLGS